MQAIGWGHEARSRASTDANIDSSRSHAILQVLSDPICLFFTLGKSSPPQNLQLNFEISNSKQLVGDFVEELAFQNELRNSFCEMSFDVISCKHIT